MYKITILVASFFLCLSCKGVAAENTASELDKTTSEPIEASNSAIHEDNVQPKTFEYKGTIDDKHDIYLSFSYGEDNDDYFRESVLGKGSKITVFGTYTYKKSKESAQLEGEVHAASKTITLKKLVYGELDEVFTGKYTDDYNKIEGTWEKVKKGTKSPFVIQKISYNPKALKLYASVLQRFTEDIDGQRIQINGLVTDSKNISFSEIVDNIGRYKFSNNHFWGEVSSESPGESSSSSEYELDVKVLSLKNTDLFVVKAYESYKTSEIEEGGDWGDDDDDDAEISYESIETTEDKTQVWMFINNSMQDIFVENKDMNNNLAYKAYELNNQLIVVDTNKNIKWKLAHSEEGEMIQD